MLSHFSTKQTVYSFVVVGAVLFLAAPTSAFAVDEVTPTGSPSPTPTETIPVSIDPTYSVVTLDERQFVFILFPLLIIMLLTIANFVIRASAPLSFRRSR